MKKQTKIILGVTALVVVIAVLLGVYFATRPDTNQGAKALTIVVVHGDGSTLLSIPMRNIWLRR